MELFNEPKVSEADRGEVSRHFQKRYETAENPQAAQLHISKRLPLVSKVSFTEPKVGETDRGDVSRPFEKCYETAENPYFKQRSCLCLNVY